MDLLITLIIVLLFFWGLFWLKGKLGLPAPTDKAVNIVLAVLGILALLYIALGNHFYPFHLHWNHLN